MESAEFGDLIRRARAGDRPAQDGLFARLRPYLERLARPYADPGHAGESTSDLVQETELRLWQRLDQFRPAENHEHTVALFLNWTRKVVRRVGLNRRRFRTAQVRQPRRPIASLDRPATGDPARRPGADDPATRQPTPSANVRAGEEARLVLQALDGLPDETDRDVLRLRFREGLSLRQIAPRLRL